MATEGLTREWIADRLERESYVITRHAEVERRNDRLSIAEVEESLRNGTILEAYADDPRGPSCLVAGKAGERDVHVVCGRNTDDWLVIITVYIPSHPKWRTPTERNR